MSLTRFHTWNEIHCQPDIWTAWAPELQREATAIRDWISSRQPQAIWLSGAGTSAFIGDTLSHGPSMHPLVSLPTTDVVACPSDHLGTPGHLLCIQFGRSGDSSESVGLLDLLDAHRPDADRLHITCNPTGALAKRPAPGPGETRVLRLPEATHDRGFAMTSSYTTMLLSALACLTDALPNLPALSTEARRLLTAMERFQPPRPTRAIFLGAGALKGAARECALKVLELTAGQTLAAWDSPLGFRHGPKAAIEAGTQVYILCHPDPHTAAYDRDLAAELRQQFPDAPVTIIGPNGDLPYEAPSDARAAAVLAVLPAQVLAARWSADLGLNVDDPFEGQNLSRVVAGVTLYPWSAP